jgi:hypothetical protein
MWSAVRDRDPIGRLARACAESRKYTERAGAVVPLSFILFDYLVLFYF